MGIQELLQELRDDKEIGIAAVAQFNYGLEDLDVQLGRLRAALPKLSIYMKARAEAKKTFNDYLGRIQKEKEAELSTLNKQYSPRLKTIKDKIKTKRKVLQKEQDSFLEKKQSKRTQYLSYAKDIKKQINAQKVFKRTSEGKMAVEIAELTLTSDEEEYVRKVEAEIEDYNDKVPTSMGTTLFLTDPRYIEISEKVETKDHIIEKYTDEMKVYDAKIARHEAERDAKMKEMVVELEEMDEEFDELESISFSEIAELGAEQRKIRVDYDIARRKVESRAMDAEKEIFDRAFTYHKRRLATEFLESRES